MYLKKIDDFRWEVPRTGDMRVRGVIYSSEKMIRHIQGEHAAEQVANVACLPGIIDAALAMPDVHWGYGFPIGGVAAFDLKAGVISPGGIGYDINCGARLIRTGLSAAELSGRMDDLVAVLFDAVPSGVGSTGRVSLSKDEMLDVLERGAAWAVKKGYGEQADLAHIEEGGTLPGADPSYVSSRALERGHHQLGTLGAGNHFLEVQRVSRIYDETTARIFGLFEGQVTVLVHTGSRGLGYQVCDDNLGMLQVSSRKYGIRLPDRQLACAPVESDEGKRYYAAMAGAANYAWANRQIITHRVRETFMKVLGRSPKELGMDVVYDVAHNIGKFEEHRGRKVFVHRKGATRAFPAGHPSIPADYRAAGQPVLVPGTMGTESYVLAGTETALAETWGSTCHGAGRVMSRKQALRGTSGRELARRLQEAGIAVRSESWKTLAEEAPSAYKVVGDVVDVCHRSGISRKVAQLKPIGVVKG